MRGKRSAFNMSRSGGLCLRSVLFQGADVSGGYITDAITGNRLKFRDDFRLIEMPKAA